MRISFQKPEHLNHLQEIHPNLFFLLGCFYKYAYDKNLPVVITSVIRDRLPMSVSDTHGQGRAIDISVNGWPIDECLRVVEYFRDNYSYLGAISKTSGEGNPLVHHDVGYGRHFHLQCRP